MQHLLERLVAPARSMIVEVGFQVKRGFAFGADCFELERGLAQVRLGWPFALPRYAGRERGNHENQREQ